VGDDDFLEPGVSTGVSVTSDTSGKDSHSYHNYESYERF
jgi:hypothetical protein